MSIVDKHLKGSAKDLSGNFTADWMTPSGLSNTPPFGVSYGYASPLVYTLSETSGYAAFAGWFEAHWISINGSGQFTRAPDGPGDIAILQRGDTLVALTGFTLDKTPTAIKAFGNAEKYFHLGSSMVGHVGLALDVGVTIIDVLVEEDKGVGPNPNFTLAEQKFIGSAPGLIFGAAALLLAPEGILGLAIGLGLGAAGNLLGSAVQASINSFLRAAPDATVGAYFDSFLGPVGQLRDDLIKGNTYVQTAITSIQDAPTPANLFAQLQSTTSSTQELMAAYKQQTLNEFNNLEYTSNILTQIANEYAIINPGVSAEALAAAIKVYKYAVSLVNTYLSNTTILNALQATEKSTEIILISSVNLLAHDPTNAGALASGYSALGTLTTAVATAVQQLQKLAASSNPNNLTAGTYGELVTSTSVNGTIQGATTGADLLIGTSAAEIFDGLGSTGNNNSGTDVVIGGGGADTFLFNPTYGSLEINEDDPTGVSSAVLKLGQGITASMLTVSGTGQGSVLLTISNNGGTILLDNEIAGTEYGVTAVQFSDGTTLTRAQMAQLATVPTIGADVLYGASNGQTFNGLGGGDTIISNGDGDTYIFNRGYGALEINAHDPSAAPTSQLLLGTGIAPTDVLVTADQGGNIILTIENGGVANSDVITLDYELASNGVGVQSVAFSNGTTWTHAQLLQYAAVPTAGADDLYLSSSATIDGLGGADIIHGGGGADTFIYKSGYGSLEIAEQAKTGPSTATLQLGTSLALGTATITGDAAGDILLHFSATDIVQIDHALFGNTYGISQVTDSSGATLTAAQLITTELNGLAGSLTVYGTSGADTFANLGHADIAVGNGGGDTFNYAVGAGTLDIQEFDTNPLASNVLALAGISSTQVTISVVKQTFGSGIVLTDGVAGDTITIDNMNSDTAQGLSAIKFLGNNVTLSREQVLGRALGTLTVTGVGTASAPLTGGSGSNIITATGANAYITSPGLYDQITDTFGTATITLTAPASGFGHDASIALGGGGNKLTAVNGNVTVTGVAGSDNITLASGNSAVTGGGAGNTVSALGGNTTITLGSAKAFSSNNTISLLTGGRISAFGNGNQITLGSATVTDNTQNGGTTVVISGSSNNVNVRPSNNNSIGDSAGSSGNTFTLNSPLSNAVNVLGSADMVFVSGGAATITDKGIGTDIYVAQNANLVISNFTGDSSSIIGLLPAEGYSTLSSLVSALVSDGHFGSFLALGGTGGTGTGIDFVGVSVAALTTFANSGTHFAFDASFPNGWH